MICRWGKIPLETNLFRCEYETHVSPHAVGPWNKSGLDARLGAVSREFGAAPYSSPGAVSDMAGRRVFTNRSRHGGFEGRHSLALAAAHLDADGVRRRAILINVEDQAGGAGVVRVGGLPALRRAAAAAPLSFSRRRRARLVLVGLLFWYPAFQCPPRLNQPACALQASRAKPRAAHLNAIMLPIGTRGSKTAGQESVLASCKALARQAKLDPVDHCRGKLVHSELSREPQRSSPCEG